jgi:hypothetical protein
MFGPKKNKIQVKSVEDFLRGEDARIPAPENNKSRNALVIPQNVKLYIAQSVVLLFIVALILVAFLQMSTLKSQVAELQAGKEGEAKALKTQVGELAAKLEKSNGEVALLSETVTGLKNDLEAERSEQARAEAAAAARKAATADAGKKKPPKTGR